MKFIIAVRDSNRQIISKEMDIYPLPVVNDVIGIGNLKFEVINRFHNDFWMLTCTHKHNAQELLSAGFKPLLCEYKKG